MARRSRAGVADRTAAARTDWFAVGAGPAQAQEHVLDPAVGHPHDLRGAERACRRGKQEVLRHDDPSREDQISTLMPGSAKKYNPDCTGGGCYIRPDRPG